MMNKSGESGISKDRLDALLDDFEVRGAKAIEDLRKENPAEYHNMITDLILMDLSDEENQ